MWLAPPSEEGRLRSRCFAMCAALCAAFFNLCSSAFAAFHGRSKTASRRLPTEDHILRFFFFFFFRLPPAPADEDTRAWVAAADARLEMLWGGGVGDGRPAALRRAAGETACARRAVDLLHAGLQRGSCVLLRLLGYERRTRTCTCRMHPQGGHAALYPAKGKVSRRPGHHDIGCPPDTLANADPHRTGLQPVNGSKRDLFGCRARR